MFSNKATVLWLSVLLIAAGWVSGKLGYPQVNHGLMTAAALVAGYHIARNAITLIRSRIVGIETLVTVAAAGAIFIGEYWEAAAVTALFALGSFLEAKTLDKTRAAIKSLTDLAPLTATIKTAGGEVEVPAEEVTPGDLVVVRPGGKIPVDGTVVKGYGTVNEAPVTGEPMPVEKASGDRVYSGTVNEAGYFEVITEKAGQDTTFARILSLVEDAQESKSPTERFLNRFSKYYTPGIILLSLAVYLYTRDIEMALTLLVIACPGALVIATPVSIVSAIGNGARRGVLIKGGDHLENAGKVSLVAFDKTGTLTYGRPSVKNLVSFGCSERELIEKAARVEINSEHHLARAVVERAGGRLLPADDFKVFPGKGAAGTVDGKVVRLGNRTLMAELGITISPEAEECLQGQESKGYTAILVSEEDRIIGVISVADRVREEAPSAVRELKALGVQKIVMLTGDNRITASAIAAELGISEFRAGLLPQEKVEEIQRYKQQGYVVAMVGDGINDAPALATADVGIAMGAAGTDAALEVADVILMSDRLGMVPYAIGLSRSALRNIKQNVTFAILVVAVLLAGVLGKQVFLASGMLVHEASVMAVILNAMRLLGYKSGSVRLKEADLYENRDTGRGGLSELHSPGSGDHKHTVADTGARQG